MRISTMQAYNSSLDGMQRDYTNLTRTQEQISSGKRIETAADDPVASVRLLQLDQEQALNEQYKGNLLEAKNALPYEESILESVGNVLQRIREIAVEAGNGARNLNDRKALAAEIFQREDELLSLLNSKDSSGKYLFSGSQGDVQPFVRNPNGTYQYQGDESQRYLQIASSSQVAISDSGKVIFEDIINANRVTTSNAAGNTGTGSLSKAVVIDKLDYDNLFPSSVPPATTDGVSLHFISSAQYVIYDPSTIPPGYNWNTYDPLAPPTWQLASGALDNKAGVENQISYAGVKVIMDGRPAAGDEFSINRQPDSEKRSLLNVVSDLRKALESSQDNVQGSNSLRDATAIALLNLDSVNNQVLSVRGQVGARLNTVDTTEAFISDVTLINTSVISDLRDLDYAEALSRLSLQSTILQAAQQSYVKINGLSLFNYLN